MATAKIDTPDNIFHFMRWEVRPRGTGDPSDPANLNVILHCSPVPFTARHRVSNVMVIALSYRNDVIVEVDSPYISLECRVLSVYVSVTEIRIELGPGRDISKWIHT